METTGYKLPTTIVSNGIGVNGWLNPTNILVTDDLFTVSQSSVSTLTVGTFNFNIPANSTIGNTTIQLKGKSNTNATLRIFAVTTISGVEQSFEYLPAFTGFTSTNTVYTLTATNFGHSWTTDEINNLQLRFISDVPVAIDSVRATVAYTPVVVPTPNIPENGQILVDEFVQGQRFTIAQGVTNTDLFFFANSFNYPDGSEIFIEDFYGNALLTLSQGVEGLEENVRITDIEHDFQGTGLVKISFDVIENRGLKFKPPYDHDINLVRTHSATSEFVISNSAPFYDRFLKKGQIGALVSAPITVKDESNILTTHVTEFDFIGTGVEVTVPDPLEPNKLRVQVNSGGVETVNSSDDLIQVNNTDPANPTLSLNTTNLANNTSFINALTANSTFQTTVNNFVSGGGGGSIRIDQTPDNGNYGLLAGDVDGVNDTFTVSAGEYATGQIAVYLNGLMQEQGATEDFTESDPATGEITFVTPPIIGSIISVIYSEPATPVASLEIEENGVSVETAVSKINFLTNSPIVTNPDTGEVEVDLTSISGIGGGGTKIAIDTTEVTKSNDPSYTEAYRVTIPGGTLGDNNAIRFGILSGGNGNANGGFRISYGGEVLKNINSNEFSFGLIIANKSESSQTFTLVSGSNYQTNDGNIAVDSSIDQDLVIEINTAGTGIVTLRGIIVEKITSASSGSGNIIQLTAGEDLEAGDTVGSGLFRGDVVTKANFSNRPTGFSLSGIRTWVKLNEEETKWLILYGTSAILAEINSDFTITFSSTITTGDSGMQMLAKKMSDEQVVVATCPSSSSGSSNIQFYTIDFDLDTMTFVGSSWTSIGTTNGTSFDDYFEGISGIEKVSDKIVAVTAYKDTNDRHNYLIVNDYNSTPILTSSSYIRDESYLSNPILVDENIILAFASERANGYNCYLRLYEYDDINHTISVKQSITIGNGDLRSPTIVKSETENIYIAFGTSTSSNARFMFAVEYDVDTQSISIKANIRGTLLQNTPVKIGYYRNIFNAISGSNYLYNIKYNPVTETFTYDGSSYGSENGTIYSMPDSTLWQEEFGYSKFEQNQYFLPSMSKDTLIGIVQNNVAKGGNAQVLISGIDENQVGLQTGLRYNASQGGLTPNSSGIMTALSATKLKV